MTATTQAAAKEVALRFFEIDGGQRSSVPSGRLQTLTDMRSRFDVVRPLDAVTVPGLGDAAYIQHEAADDFYDLHVLSGTTLIELSVVDAPPQDEENWKGASGMKKEVD